MISLLIASKPSYWSTYKSLLLEAGCTALQQWRDIYKEGGLQLMEGGLPRSAETPLYLISFRYWPCIRINNSILEHLIAYWYVRLNSMETRYIAMIPNYSPVHCHWHPKQSEYCHCRSPERYLRLCSCFLLHTTQPIPKPKQEDHVPLVPGACAMLPLILNTKRLSQHPYISSSS